MRANKLDSNQPSIVRGLRACGFTVQPLNKIKDGCPDILVGAQRKNFLFEIKDPSRPPSARKLTEDEYLWHLHWKGQIHIITTVQEAVEIINDTF